MKDNFLLVPVCSRKERRKERREKRKERKREEGEEKIKGIMLRGIKSTLNKQCVSPGWRKDFYLNNSNNNNKDSKSFLIIFSVKLEQNKAER